MTNQSNSTQDTEERSGVMNIFLVLAKAAFFAAAFFALGVIWQMQQQTTRTQDETMRTLNAVAKDQDALMQRIQHRNEAQQ